MSHNYKHTIKLPQWNDTAAVQITVPLANPTLADIRDILDMAADSISDQPPALSFKSRRITKNHR